jgi:hypothetical protein
MTPYFLIAVTWLLAFVVVTIAPPKPVVLPLALIIGVSGPITAVLSS